MLKQILILTILFIIITACNPSKKATETILNNENPNFIETKYFGIRTKPITNREYLICLAWHISVYNQVKRTKYRHKIFG
jgi:hypothetical protein